MAFIKCIILPEIQSIWQLILNCFIKISKVDESLGISVFYLQLFVCVGEGCTDNEANGVHHQHIALAFLTGFLFATRLPERLAPGSFDYIGAN